MDEIFNTIDWDSMEGCAEKIADQRLTNIIKFAHGWQHGNHQKDLFYWGMRTLFVWLVVASGSQLCIMYSASLLK